MRKQEMIDGLSEILAAIEKPEFPEDGTFTLSWSGVRVAYAKAEDFGRAAGAMGGFEKGASDLYLNAIRNIGQIDFEVYIERSVTCKKIVKGTKTIPAQPERVTTYITAAVPERIVEDVEWVCPDSFVALAGAESQVPSGVSAAEDVATAADEAHKPEPGEAEAALGSVNADNF